MILPTKLLRTKLLWIGADLAVTDPRVRGALPANEIFAESTLAGGIARLKTAGCEVVVLSLASLTCSGEQALDELYRLARRRKNLTLLFASKNEHHNNAVVLKDLLEGMRKPPTGTGPGVARATRGRQAKRMPR